MTVPVAPPTDPWRWIRAQLAPEAILRWLPVAIVVAVGAFVSYRLNTNLRAERDLVVHSHQVIEAGQRLLIAAADAETGQRGYLITGDKAYLEPFDSGRATARDALNKLAELVSDNTAQHDRVTRLDALMAEKDAELGQAIAARDQNGFEASRALVAANRGKRIMDEVRTGLGELNRMEAEILQARETAVGRAETRVVMAGLVIAAASVMTRLVLAWAAARRKSDPRS